MANSDHPELKSQLRQAKICQFALLLFLASSCNKDVGFMKSTEEEIPIPSTVVSGTTVDGVQSVRLVPSDSEIQVLKVEEIAELEGTEASFPPGSLSVATTISIKTGNTVADDSFVLSLGLDQKVTAVGPTVSIQADQEMDTVEPFTLAIPMPPVGASLADDSTREDRIVVTYQVNKAADGKSYSGIIPRSELIIVGNIVKFATTHFGSFQSAEMSGVIAGRVEMPDDNLVAAAATYSYHTAGFLGLYAPTAANPPMWGHTLLPSLVRKPELTVTTGYIQRDEN